MCEPTTVAYIGLALAAAGTAYTVDATNKNASAASKQAKEDAKVQDAQSRQAMQAGNIEEERHLRKVRQMIGTQRAQAAAQGLDPNFGTPADLQAETASLGGADAMTIRLNAMRQAWGFDVGATNSLNLATATKARARNENTATVLTGLGSMANQYSSTRTPKTKYNTSGRGGLDESLARFNE